jgi:adenine/guanine phosphoribosyltransferase-like PRPP-binding protein
MALLGGTLEAMMVMIERSGMVTWIVLATILSNSRSGPRSLILLTLPSSTLRKMAE